MTRAVRAYPWQALESLVREEVRLGRGVRQALARAVDVPRWTRELSTLLQLDADLVVHSAQLSQPPRQAVMLYFRVDPSGLRLGLGAGPQLADLLFTRMLDRPPRIARADATVDAVLHGALAALVTELARRTGEDAVLTAIEPWRAAEVLLTEATLILGGQPYAVYGWADPRGVQVTPPSPRSLMELGALPLALPLVVGQSPCHRRLLAELRVGDAWIPGEPLWLDAERSGRVALVAPGGERAVQASVTRGQARITELTTALPWSLDGAHSDEAASDTSGYGAPEELLMTDTHPVMDAPILIRVELGSVTLSAAEWARLTVGDVLETDVSLSAPVVLRAAGRALARGELVEVEGHIGVRITQLEAAQ
ncbi:MAG: FliM/FliN family flagellar motor switch protein [Polyangiaceae bacterium]|nr:FliM/FliN family flagellar motor switch protein [Polyangiaceae bacterium]MCW5790308.1 FliM/FliN family flagellar motor switch protein [Polyangiaceae bacterium]